MARTWHEQVDAAAQNLRTQMDRLDLWTKELSKVAGRHTTTEEQDKIITGLNESIRRVAEQIDVLQRLGAL